MSSEIQYPNKRLTYAGKKDPVFSSDILNLNENLIETVKILTGNPPFAILSGLTFTQYPVPYYSAGYVWINAGGQSGIYYFSGGTIIGKYLAPSSSDVLPKKNSLGEINNTYKIYTTAVLNASSSTSSPVFDYNMDKYRYINNIINPVGMITMWAGTVPPIGWALCDGTNGTPDLKGRFIVGYDRNDSDYNAIGKNSGQKEVTLTAPQMPIHNHNVQLVGIDLFPDPGFTAIQPTATGINYNKGDGGVTGDILDNAGGGLPHENRPPYYTLAYIIKL